MSLVKTFRRSKCRIIQIKRIVENLTKDLATGIRVQGFLKSLIGLHAITGCDTVSAFTGKGKARALKLLMKNRTYVDAFMDLGLSWNISDETGKEIERFVCELYEKKMQEVNLLRYQLHCAKAEKVVYRHASHFCSCISREPTIKLEFGEEIYFHFQKYLCLVDMAGRLQKVK